MIGNERFSMASSEHQRLMKKEKSLRVKKKVKFFTVRLGGD